MSRYALYRHYNAADELLYVGVSKGFGSRHQNHQHFSKWFYEIAKISIEWHSDQQELAKAEAKAICEESPMHNKQKFSDYRDRRGQRTETFSVKLSPSEKDQLQALAMRWQMSMGSAIRQLIQRETKRG